MQFVDGCKNDVLLVLEIFTNLLSIYQNFHFGDGKTMKFTPHVVVIGYLYNP